MIPFIYLYLYILLAGISTSFEIGFTDVFLAILTILGTIGVFYLQSTNKKMSTIEKKVDALAETAAEDSVMLKVHSDKLLDFAVRVDTVTQEITEIDRRVTISERDIKNHIDYSRREK